MICLKKYDACSKALHAMLGDALLVQRWWAHRNAAFGGRTPWETYRADPQRVCDYLLEHLQK